jgi:hypothetical protein
MRARIGDIGDIFPATLALKQQERPNALFDGMESASGESASR